MTHTQRKLNPPPSPRTHMHHVSLVHQRILRWGPKGLLALYIRGYIHLPCMNPLIYVPPVCARAG